MRGGRLLGITLILGLAYTATPYIAVWRLYSALRDGNSAALAGMVDWKSVREGVKQDIAEGVIGMTERQLISTNRLPPFGTGFALGIANNIVDHEFTPDRIRTTVLALASSDPAEQNSVMENIKLFHRAFFSAPRRFELSLQAPGCESEDQPLRVRLELDGMAWKVVRIWLPQELVEHVQSRT